MKTISITINELDLASVEGAQANTAEYCRLVESRLAPEFAVKWTINRNASGWTPEPSCIDDNGDMEPHLSDIVQNASEWAFGQESVWA